MMHIISPLLLARAVSIHKSQGQTIDRIKVDLRRVFEKGEHDSHPCSCQLILLRYDICSFVSSFFIGWVGGHRVR